MIGAINGGGEWEGICVRSLTLRPVYGVTGKERWPCLRHGQYFWAVHTWQGITEPYRPTHSVLRVRSLGTNGNVEWDTGVIELT